MRYTCAVTSCYHFRVSMAVNMIRTLSNTSVFLRQSLSRNGRRTLRTSSSIFAAHDAEFAAAKERLGTLTEDPGNQAKLQIYALFKQSTLGKCNTKKPGMIDFVGKVKWDAWNSLGDLSQDDAQLKYIALIDELAANDPSSSETESATTASGSGNILVEVKDKMQIVTLNRPAKKNALTLEMYDEISTILESTGTDKNITLTVFTGNGNYYCSGNDLENFMNIDPADIGEMALNGEKVLKRFVGSFIDFPRPLCAAINGPAVGISVTLLGLFDAVYASDKATFYTPFSILGQSAEGCSSYRFPKIMGSAKANEMLLFNKKLTAHEAYERNLVSEVFPDHSFQSEVWTKLQAMAQLPPNSLKTSKVLIREAEREILHATNERECRLLVERWQSDECMQAVMNFFQAK